jgi:hypothetical protein
MASSVTGNSVFSVAPTTQRLPSPASAASTTLSVVNAGSMSTWYPMLGSMMSGRDRSYGPSANATSVRDARPGVTRNRTGTSARATGALIRDRQALHDLSAVRAQ